MFSQGTGWLGWTPETVLHTPIPQIMLALQGKIDFIKKTNPWGSGEDKSAAGGADEKPDPAGAAQQLMAFVARNQKQVRTAGKRRRR